MSDLSLSPLLHVTAHEVLCVLFEYFVYFVQNCIDIVAELFVALLDVLAGLRLGLLDLVGAPGGLLLPAGVLRRHADLHVRASTPDPIAGFGRCAVCGAAGQDPATRGPAGVIARTASLETGKPVRAVLRPQRA